jgi:hypothetical protein
MTLKQNKGKKVLWLWRKTGGGPARRCNAGSASGGNGNEQLEISARASGWRYKSLKRGCESCEC